jgi:hypothetical protein
MTLLTDGFFLTTRIQNMTFFLLLNEFKFDQASPTDKVPQN